MQIPTSPVDKTAIDNKAVNNSPQKTNKASGELSSYELSNKVRNKSIIQAHLKQSSDAADNPQKLLFKAAINEINEVLAPYLGENATQTAYESDIDFSPEATAERIVHGATGFFTAFVENNPELSSEEAVNRFNDVITQGIEQGFEDAKGILDSLQVLEGKISDDINATYDFVQAGLNNFMEQVLADLNAEQETLVATDAVEPNNTP